MAEKPQKVIMTGSLIALILFLSIDTVNGWSPYSEFWINDTPEPGQTFQFSTEILDDHNAVIATSNGSIKVVGSENGSEDSKECSLPFRPIKDMSILPLRRLTNKTVLISVYENGQSGDSKLILVNTKNCKYDQLYKGVLPEKRMIFTSKNSSDQRFTVITSGKEYCQGYKVCRLFFNPFYEKFEPLDFNFQTYVRSIEPATSFDGNLFVVGVWHHATNLYTMRLYDLSANSTIPKYKDLISFPNWMNLTRLPGTFLPLGIRNIIGWGKTLFNYEIKSSGLSVCWCDNDQGNKSIHCSVFREDGSLKFNQTLVYPEPMFPLRVENIPNGIILFSLKTNRFLKREWSILQVAVVTSNIDENISESRSKTEENQAVKIKHRKYEILCHYIVGWKVKMNEIDESITVEYMCYDEWGTSNHILHIK